MTTARTAPGIVWIKREWRMRKNPFPSTGMAGFGRQDDRENGLLYEPGVHAEQLQEAIEKFILGMSYSGLKFGYLWSVGIVPGDSDARGFGKSVLMQHLAREVNKDFGESAYLQAGLDEEDAAEVPVCCLVTGFDTANVRSLGAALFAAVEYAVTYSAGGEEKPLAERLREQLVQRVGSADVRDLVKAVTDEHRSIKGRTLGPPDDKLIVALCEEGGEAAAEHLRLVTPVSRSRNGASCMATFLLFAAAAGMKHVLVFCDQLEDLASTTTARAKRILEVEKFRDVLVETLPMADMVTMVVTMHPRASLAIGTAWALADLPAFELTEANRQSTVRLPALRNAAQAAQLLKPYLTAATKEGTVRDEGDELFPFTSEAIACLFDRSTRKPRDVLRKAHIVTLAAAAENLSRIDTADVLRYLDTPAPPQPREAGVMGIANAIDWSQE
ncbi:MULTISPECIES: hypothetical protein [Actinomycetes]|uniref:Uncharacterized protein n=3 Tax=Actinomycetes TaxID=1760 RepID=A0ABP5ZMZ4_9ACTN|nr:hypothetical protein [Streptomyces sp. CMSTAAHL-2]MCE3031365.1 hypothetical protein [Streptomyces sp. CMSTAAHL-2]